MICDWAINGWSGLPVAQYGNLWCAGLGLYWHVLRGTNAWLRAHYRHGIWTSERAALGIPWHCLRGPSARLRGTLWKSQARLYGPPRHYMSSPGVSEHQMAQHFEPRRAGLDLPWHYILRLNTPVWAPHGTTFKA